jgi:hypothetical protein
MFTWEEAALLRQMLIALAWLVVAGMMGGACWMACAITARR